MKGKEKVFIYFNLHKKVFSVRSMKSGIVIAYVTEIELDNAIFKVSEKGRQKVLSERRKNVHAGIVGFISEKEVFKSQEKYKKPSHMTWFKSYLICNLARRLAARVPSNWSAIRVTRARMP